FTNAMEQLEQAFTAIGQVLGHDGRPLVEDRGVDTQLCATWRETLTHINDELGYWSRRFKQVYGLKADVTARMRPAAYEDIEPDAHWDDVEEVNTPTGPLQ